MTPTLLTYVMIALIWADYIFERWLSHLNAKTWQKPIPEELSQLYDEQEYTKARNYASDKRNVALISSFLSTAIMIALLLWGVFGRLSGFVNDITDHSILQSLFFFGILGAGSGLLSLPFSLYQTFVIEEKYGFNKTTPALFLGDLIKGIIIGVLFGGGLLAAVVFFYQWQPQWFWLYAWGLFTAFSVFMAMFYTSLLVPIFNKLSPLPEGSLRDSLNNLGERTGFPLNEVSVIDGSKRSSKANAYFSGLGPKKMIVLFDTLIEQLTEQEILAVMAHEIGHYQHKHVLQTMVISTINSGVMLFLLSLCVSLPIFHEALGGSAPAFHLGLIAFSLLYAPVSTVLSIGMNMLSRKFEYQADDYARKWSSAEDLISSLKKLHKDSLSNIQPHPAFVFVHFSHPTLLQRIRNLSK
jgi:STE24 endopeptidase